MPDPPPAKDERAPYAPLARRIAACSYAELHAKTNFSFLEGASHPDELVGRAAELGLAALAVADRNSLAGVVRAHAAAKQAGVKLLVGAEVFPNDAPRVVLLATDRAAYGRLSRLLTVGRRRAAKGACELNLADVAEHAQGLLALCPLTHDEALLPAPSADDEGFPAEQVRRDRLPDVPARLAALSASAGHPRLVAARELAAYRELFGDRCYALAELHYGPDDGELFSRMTTLSKRVRLPLAAANDVHFHAPRRRALCDVLSAVRWGTTVAEAAPRLMANAERQLKSPEEMAELFARCPAAIARTIEIASRCAFSLDELRYEYPEELCPVGETPIGYLSDLAWRGAHKRYPAGVPDKVRSLIEHELRLIAELRYAAYFLTVWDLVRFARSRGILCQGRGSAANSAVCYCLGVTSVDPERMDLLFERFISRERNEAPDIDVDFEHERREEILQYVYEKYGRDRAALTAEVITYRGRSAVRDVGKALGLSLDRIDALSKTLDGYHREGDWDARCREAGVDPESQLGRRLAFLVRELVGFPRHLSQHVGGMVITRGPLAEIVPIENAAMHDRTVIQWDKNDLDELGVLKVDCLALGMLTAIRKCFGLLREHYGRRLTLANVPPEDQAVYDMICRADTMGVFQIESRAQMSMLPRLQPRSFYDLVIEVAIVRPGPIQGNMVHPYLRRRRGDEPVAYPNEAIRSALEKTMGVPIFQEQAMRLAVVAAGFTPGEADQLRRAMGGWRRPGLIEQFRQKLIAGMRANGLSDEYAERVFQQLRGFGEYGFPESHAASFALLVYVSAWLKHYYPAAFAASLINSQPMGFYAPAQLIRDAREHGVTVRCVDVNHSDRDCTLELLDGAVADDAQFASASSTPAGDPRGERYALRLGLRLLAGLPTTAVDSIVAARINGPFVSLADFARRTGVGQAVLSRLARADAFRSLGADRRGALWQALAEQDQPGETPLFDRLSPDVDAARPKELPRLDALAEVLADYRTAGLSLRAHPIKFLRPALDQLRVTPADQLPSVPVGRHLRVAGLVLVRQRPSTASGITFVTLEDETGVANLVVRPSIWQRWRRAAKYATAMVAHGQLEREGPVIHILVNRLEDLADLSLQLDSQSRDFR